MCLHFLRAMLVCLVVLSALAAVGQSREIRVCADPDNLPFSNRSQQGFENRIAELVAKDLHARLTYVWQRMGRGFVREYLGNSKCDLLIGIPANYRPVLTTTPYYRSSYVFVYRTAGSSAVTSFNTPELHALRRIGVQVLDEEYTPPGEALARRGLQGAIVGFDTIGDGGESIIRAVAEQKVDMSVVWGPLAGYFAQKYGSQLTLRPVEPEVDPPGLPFTFAIAMGVRKGNFALRDELDKILAGRKPEIRRLLTAYGVPQLPLPAENLTESAAY